jgi:hypothetical protein
MQNIHFIVYQDIEPNETKMICIANTVFLLLILQYCIINSDQQ